MLTKNFILMILYFNQYHGFVHKKNPNGEWDYRRETRLGASTVAFFTRRRKDSQSYNSGRIARMVVT